MAGDKTYIADNEDKLHRATRTVAITPTDIVWSSNPNDYTVQVLVDGKWHRAVLTCDVQTASFFNDQNIDKALVTGTDGKTHTALIVDPYSDSVTMSSIKTDDHSTLADTTTGETALNVYSEEWSDIEWQDNVNVYKVIVTGSDNKKHTALLTTHVSGTIEVIVRGIPPLQLLGAVENSLSELKAFGGTEQGLPEGYTALTFVENTSGTYIDLGVPFNDADSVLEVTMTAVNNVNYIATARDANAMQGIAGSSSTFKAYIDPVSLTSDISKTAGHKYKFTFTANNGDATFKTEDLTAGTSDTQTTVYTVSQTQPTATLGLFGNSYGNKTDMGADFYGLKYTVAGELVLNLIPCRKGATIGVFDLVSRKFFTATQGSLMAGLDTTLTPTPSNPMDIVCNNGALKILDKNDWTIFTNPTSIAGQGVYISADGKWYTADDNGAGVAIPLTIGKQYTLVVHKKTTNLGTILRYGQSPQETPTGAGIQLTDWYRGDITDGQMISFVAKQPYLVMQLSAVAVEAGMVQEAIEVLEAQGSDYTFLKYIEATGTQYIETGLSGPARWVGAGQGTSDSVGSKCILSGLTGSANVYLASRFGTSQTAGKSWTIGITHSQTPTLSYAEYDIDFASNSFTGTINGEAVSRSNSLTFTTWSIGTAFGTGTTQYPFVGYIYRQQAYQNNVLVGDFIPAIRNSDNVVGMYDTVSGTFFTNAGTGDFIAGTPLGDGEVLKLTPSNDTAGVANLLKIDNYVDTQEILTGLINHQLGILVLNGLETYITPYSFYIHTDSCDAYITLGGAQSMQSQNSTGVCTHLKLANKDIWSLPGYPNTFAFNGKQLHLNFAHDVIGTTSSSTVEEASAAIKSYIAAQYAAGTPVIIVYPLATEYAEPAPVAQTMNVVAGDNTLSLTQQGMTPLTLEATYTAGVSVTITEIEDANIGNDVEVVIA